jgi:RNA 2',3'-cyclic 3'-phosphodiesterase
MRLFVAIEPPASALDELASAVAPLQAAAPELRWTSRNAWHVTVAFLGEVDEAILPGLSTRLARAAHRHPPLELALAGGGAFPAPARARVLWAGLCAERSVLRLLAASVAAGARRAGAPPPDEGRKYSPHLTVARCREPADVSPLTAALSAFSGTEWTASSIHLVRSYLDGGRPSRYEDVGEWPLAASR